jgi:hypothetical protein
MVAIGKSREKDGKMTIKVIGAGFGQTGTSTLRAVMEELGFGPCYQSYVLFSRPTDIEFWDKVDQGNAVDFNELFSEFQASVGFPGYIYYKQIMEYYPDAKVLLSIRDPEEWYENASKTILVPDRNPGNKELADSIREFNPYLGECIDRIADLHRKVLHEEIFEGKFEDKDFAIGRFIERNQEVKKTVPPERLLVYQVTEGWEPICQFLEVPVPNKPFPHLNPISEFHKPMDREVEIIKKQYRD